GGALSIATVENDVATATRGAACAGSSDAAAIATGFASAAPQPHRTMPTHASGSDGARPNTRSPTSADAPDARSTATRPNRSMSPVPANRKTVIAPTNVPYATAPSASRTSNPSTTAIDSQLPAEPSESDDASSTSPMRRVRGSRHAASAARTP